MTIFMYCFYALIVVCGLIQIFGSAILKMMGHDVDPVWVTHGMLCLLLAEVYYIRLRED